MILPLCHGFTRALPMSVVPTDFDRRPYPRHRERDLPSGPTKGEKNGGQSRK